MSVKPHDQLPVVILAGGVGTRLREITGERVPKPLVEIGEQPILWHIMKIYGHYGFERFVLCLGYKSYEIKEYFLRHREYLADFTIRLHGAHEPVFHNAMGDEAWEVTCAETGLVAGTGAGSGASVTTSARTPSSSPMGTASATSTCRKLLEFHRDNGRVGTVTGVRPTSRYGELEVRDGRVARVQREAHRVGRIRQWGLLRVPTIVLRLPDRRPRSDARTRAAAEARA